MSNFTEIKTGGWVDEDALTGAQMTAIQAALMKCANFVEGGEYEPTNPVEVRGAGILGIIRGFFQFEFVDHAGGATATIAMTSSMAILYPAASDGSAVSVTTTDVPAGSVLLVKNDGAGSLELTVGGVIVDTLGVGDGGLYVIKTSGQGEKFI